MNQRTARALRFGVFEVALHTGEVRKSGLKIRVQEQPLQILAMLLERPGEVVTRDDLRQRLWPRDTFVDFDHSLNSAMNKLREALGDSADSPRFVETLARRGYRFIAPVEALDGLASPAEIPPEQRPQPDVEAPVAASAEVRRLRRQRLVLAAALVAAAGIGLTIWLRQPGGVRKPVVQRLTFAPKGRVNLPVISPNGRHIAYIAGRGEQTKLQIQDLDRFEPRDIDGSEGAQEYPFWSNDSKHVGFAAGSRLWRVPATGGTPAAICQLAGTYMGGVAGTYLGGAWSPDGMSIIFSVLREGLYEVPARGGTPRLVVKLDRERWGHYELPWFLLAPGRNRVLFYTAQTREGPHVTVIHSLATGKQEVVAPRGCGVYSPTGHVMYVRQSLLWALPFSLKTMTATGDAFPVARAGPDETVSVSNEGTLAYLEGEWRQQLTWRDRDGRKSTAAEDPGQSIFSLSLSPDGRRAAVSSWGEENWPDIWLHDLARGTKMRLTSDPWEDNLPIWHPSGNIIAFVCARRGNWDIFTKFADGSGAERPLAATPLNECSDDWSPDGRYLVYRVGDPKRNCDLWYLKKKDNGSGYESVPFLQTPSDEGEAAFSPDGRFLAYVSNESGKPEVYVQRFPEGGGRQQVSVNGGIQPRWRKDGRELFYLEGERLMAVPVTIGSSFAAGVPSPLFKAPSLFRQQGEVRRTYDVSADGRRFLMAEPVEEAAEPVIRVVRNWFAEFQDRRQP